MTVKADGGVDILNVRARTILVRNSCGVGHLGGGSIVFYQRGDGVWLTIGESDCEGKGFVALVVGLDGLLNRLGDLYDNS